MDNQIEQMSRKITKRIFSALLVGCMIVTACAPAATAVPVTQAPATVAPATQAPATQAPASPNLPTTDCSTLLPPEDCNKDWTSVINYTSLAQLPIGKCETRLLEDGLGQCTAVTYTDANSQVFTITVEGADAATVQDYLDKAAAYFTVQQVGGGVTPPNDENLPSLPVILVETTVEKTGHSQEELRKLRDDLINKNGGDPVSVTLADVINNVPSNPDEVLSAAIERAISEFQAAAASAGMPQDEIDKLTGTIPDEMKALMYEPGASVLLDTTTFPQDNTGYRAVLTDNPNSLAITLDWTSAPPEKEENSWLVWFSIDPPIGANAYHYYKEKCNTQSASVRISATGGSMTDYFWRVSPYYYYVGSRTADIRTNPSPSGMVHSSYPYIRTYDTYVKGGSTGGSYYIYGGWVQGSGCQ